MKKTSKGNVPSRFMELAAKRVIAFRRIHYTNYYLGLSINSVNFGPYFCLYCLSVLSVCMPHDRLRARPVDVARIPIM